VGTLKKKPIFTKDDWKQANQLERIHIWLVDPRNFELNHTDEEKFKMLRMIWGILGQTMNKQKQVDMIIDRCYVDERMAYRLIKEAEELFGKLSEVDQFIEYTALKQRLYLMADQAEQEKDYETARKCLESARQILDKQNENKPREKRVFAQVIFMDDPKAITSSSEADDIEYEEVTGEERVLEPQAVGVPSRSAAD
jgi:hypothetical protein